MDATLLARINRDCAQVAESASGAYLVACEELLALRSAEAVDQERLSQLRAMGGEIGATIAEINRVIDEVIRSAGGALPAGHDPRVVQPVLRALGDSFVLLLALRGPEDVDRLPFADPALVVQALESPTVTEFIGRHHPPE